MSAKPWQDGDHDARWQGYFADPASTVLANKVGATTAADLSAAENDLVEVRVMELRTGAVRVARTYDTAHLRAVHLHLFQDLYDWAGELRTVGMTKGPGHSFMPPVEIERPLEHAWDVIARCDRLRATDRADLARQIAYLYDFVNFAHPFREGNGRTQREFFDQLLSESGRGLDWRQVDTATLHRACHVARNDDDLDPMIGLFEAILNDVPTYQTSW